MIDFIDEKSYSKNGSIECFFIEKAKQLLKTDGIVGIILPALLDKNTPKLYIKTREIILKYFDIVSIVKLESETFGKTGTNTVTLFLRRKSVSPDISEHLKDMVNSWFECDFKTNKSFKDENILEEYCSHINIDFDLYKTILCKTIDEDIFKNETFIEYRNDFNNLTKTKNRRKTKTYKKLEKAKQKELEDQELLDYIHIIEKEKVYYFGLVSKNKNNVIIVKAPLDNKENKKFLGYDWSSSKGKEGIQYLTNHTIEDDTLSDDDKRVLENLSGLKNINTPLYNPHNKNDETKINSLISKNFNGKEIEIPDDLKKFVSKARLVDMIDFSRKDFNKEITLNPKKDKQIIGKPEWQVKLGNVVYAKGGNGFPEKYQNQKKGIPFFKVSDMNTKVNIPVMLEANHYVDETILKDEIKAHIFEKDTVIFPKVGKAIDTNKKRILGVNASFDNNTMGLIINDKIKLLPKYLFEFFNNFIKLIDIASSANPPSISATNLNELKIPVPPIDIQQDIIKECEIVDKSIEEANTNIEDLKNKIEDEIKQSKGKETKLINITSKIGSGSTPKGGEKSYKESGVTLIRSQNIYDNKFHKKGLVFIDDVQAKKLDIVIIQENDVLFNITGASVARCCIVENIYLPARVNQHVAIIRPIIKKVLPKYLQKILVSKSIKDELVTMSETSLSREAITKPQLEEFKIPLPSITVQKEIVEKIDKLEIAINKAQKVIDGASDKKKEILIKYL